jgi:3-oxoacyl-[acyl-carrier-protein] synthase-3
MGSRVAVGIAGTGAYAPPRVMTNHDFESLVDTSDEWIVQRTGIRERRFAAPDQATSDLCIQAGRQALDAAGLDASELDLVIVGTLTPDYLLPASATLVQHALGATRAGAFDVNAACTGFLTALHTGESFIAAGRARNVLVIGAECLSRFLDMSDRASCILFGDGAGAVVLGADGAGQIGPIMLAADGGLGPAITCSYEDRVIKMDGHSTYQTAVKRLTEATVAAVARAGLELDDVDLFVYHQANGRIIRAVGERLDLEPAKVADYVAHMANTSAASIPLTLSLLREDNRLRPGQKVLVAAIGAGFTWGAGIVEWGIA